MSPNVNVNFKLDTRGGHCQRFLTLALVVLLRPTESVMNESTVVLNRLSWQYLSFEATKGKKGMSYIS